MSSLQPHSFLKPESNTHEAIPGLHIIANLSCSSQKLLSGHSSFKSFIEARINELGLCQVGQVFHDFDAGGFTGVVCLTESHLSVHTWPENNYLTFDVYLSNYLKDNREVTHRLYLDVKRFFQADTLFEQFINR